MHAVASGNMCRSKQQLFSNAARGTWNRGAGIAAHLSSYLSSVILQAAHRCGAPAASLVHKNDIVVLQVKELCMLGVTACRAPNAAVRGMALGIHMLLPLQAVSVPGWRRLQEGLCKPIWTLQA